MGRKNRREQAKGKTGYALKLVDDPAALGFSKDAIVYEAVIPGGAAMITKLPGMEGSCLRDDADLDFRIVFSD